MGVELDWDRPQEQWSRTKQGEIEMFTHPLDLDDLLRELPASAGVTELAGASR